MGEIKKVVCTSCKREWQCMTGCGLSHALLQSVVREFPQEIGDKIMEEAGEAEPLFAFEYRLSVCGGCKNVVSVPVLELEGREEAFIGPCPVCQGEAALIADLDEAVCPVCNSKALAAETEGHWD